MLFTLTSLVDFLGMAVALWLALYLLGCDFSSRITLRGALVLIAVSAFFLEAYLNVYGQSPNTTAVSAILFAVVLSAWNDLTHTLLPNPPEQG